MTTLVNGKEASWLPAVQAKWDEYCARSTPPLTSDYVNYFTPRPYVDEYNRGDLKEGFTYVVPTERGRDVAMHVITGGVPWRVAEPPRYRTKGRS